MPNATFKGFRQVTKSFFDELSDSQKQGYLWFVRSNIVTGDTETYDGDIFLGTRHYGHFGSDVEALEDRLNRILYNSGLVDESGNTVVLSEIYLTKVEADETYVQKTTLFNENETAQNPLGILIIGGNDTGSNE
ncbi:MAG: hypothetical protein J6Y37_10600 [Paludibacteraceae bacterium]|nr:hypothetical protein [Paludibacteraceae bacterium]